jgi:hypothetical protein
MLSVSAQPLLSRTSSAGGRDADLETYRIARVQGVEVAFYHYNNFARAVHRNATAAAGFGADVHDIGAPIGFNRERVKFVHHDLISAMSRPYPA